MLLALVVAAVVVAGVPLQTGADREVQRILMELLNQMDGFDQTVNVKVRAAPSVGGLHGTPRPGAT